MKYNFIGVVIFLVLCAGCQSLTPTVGEPFILDEGVKSIPAGPFDPPEDGRSVPVDPFDPPGDIMSIPVGLFDPPEK